MYSPDAVPSLWVGLPLSAFGSPTQAQGLLPCEVAEVVRDFKSVDSCTEVHMKVFQGWKRYVGQLKVRNIPDSAYPAN
jgi:hypothetical protein